MQGETGAIISRMNMQHIPFPVNNLLFGLKNRTQKPFPGFCVRFFLLAIYQSADGLLNPLEEGTGF